MISPIFAIMLMQVGPNPMTGAMPGVPDELRNRPRRDGTTVIEAPQAQPVDTFFRRCLRQAQDDPAKALDYANAWRKEAKSQLDLAQSSHCLGLALTGLSRFDEARRIFEVAADEAPAADPAYRARLAAMAGNAALAEGKPEEADPLFTQALAEAGKTGDAELLGSIYIDRASALVGSGRLDLAAGQLDAARSVQPDNARAWLLSATLSRRENRLADAQQQIQRAVELDSKDPAIGLEAGVIAALAGRDEDARKSFESVLIVAPDSDEANRATAYLEQLKQ